MQRSILKRIENKIFKLYRTWCDIGHENGRTQAYHRAAVLRLRLVFNASRLGQVRNPADGLRHPPGRLFAPERCRTQRHRPLSAFYTRPTESMSSGQYIRPVFTSYESVALGVVEPLDLPFVLSHRSLPSLHPVICGGQGIGECPPVYVV